MATKANLLIAELPDGHGIDPIMSLKYSLELVLKDNPEALPGEYVLCLASADAKGLHHHFTESSLRFLIDL